MGGSDWLYWRNWSCLCTWACCTGNGYCPGSFCHDVLGWLDVRTAMSWGLIVIRVVVDCGGSHSWRWWFYPMIRLDEAWRSCALLKLSFSANMDAKCWLYRCDAIMISFIITIIAQNPGRLTSQTSLCSPWLSRDSKKKGLRLGNYFLWQIF